MRLAVIPARGGSKRILRKNIRDFCGKPIIAWSIQAALQSGCFDRVVVSTEDAEIAEVAVRFGAEVPFIRPESLSDDYTETIPVIQHAINWHIDQGEDVGYACCIYATAPFCRSDDLRDGLVKLEESSCDFVFPVANYVFPIQRAVRITSENRVQMFQPDQFSTRSQDLEPAYHDAGQWYWGTSEAWLNGLSIFSSNSRPVVIPTYRICDIDTEEDWQRAELMYRAM